ncbi:hypothetical protein [Ruminococcus sp.]|jgi:hypothetical protein|uniref:hypothetical protein n=1 Tax=Ruminococcus sp. TaxID=41978 RepID=UPI0025EF7AFA|nr:hypothetical protein [Ruminococcus sp.]
MILKRGITGFFDGDNCSLTENGYMAFKQVCYCIQTNTTNLLDICKPDNANYFYAHFNTYGKELYVLLNKYHPIIAFTNELTFMNKVFINVPENHVYFMNYDIVSADILNSPFTNIEYDLFKVELEQIKYWNPTSIGNIIFNEWD